MMTSQKPTGSKAPRTRAKPAIFSGQHAAEAAFLDAFTSGRLHHGWLITGPRGVGKATLAWRIARFLLAQPAPDDGGLFGAPPPPTSLDIDPEHPVARRVAALSEARLETDPPLLGPMRRSASRPSSRWMRCAISNPFSTCPPPTAVAASSSSMRRMR